MLTTDRRTALETFLGKVGLTRTQLDWLPSDASQRRYARVREVSGRSRLLMDAPPPGENIRAFKTVDDLLTGFGLRVPKIYDHDLDAGFALIEDFGDATFTRVLAAEPSRETELYRMAAETLKFHHGRETARNAPLKPYDEAALLREVELFPDWFVPCVMGKAVEPAQKDAYMQAWTKALADVAEQRETLVLRDYHVDNLMLVDRNSGGERVGLLDFQDALIGARAYDLISLLEDARRDVSPAAYSAVEEVYFKDMQEGDVARMKLEMTLLGAQRHTKVLGIFVRLWKRDGKPIYLGHIPRLQRLLQQAFTHAALSDVAEQTRSLCPNWDTAVIQA